MSARLRKVESGGVNQGGGGGSGKQSPLRPEFNRTIVNNMFEPTDNKSDNDPSGAVQRFFLNIKKYFLNIFKLHHQPQPPEGVRGAREERLQPTVDCRINPSVDRVNAD